MGKAKKRTTSTIVTMSIIAILVLVVYYYWSNRTQPLKGETVENMSEIEKLLDRDLDRNYPDTPREVVKLYSNMLSVLYSDIEDQQLKDLSTKIRTLYDDELLAKNPEEEYYNNLFTEVASWREADRKIINYLIVNKDMEQKSVIRGVEYCVEYVSYTFQEKNKYSQKWRYLLRKNELGKWKILGWEVIIEES